MMRKHLIISLLCLTLAVIIDFVSLSSSEENSISKLKNYVKELIDESISKVQEPEFLKAIHEENANINDLKLIESYIDHFEQHQLNITLKKSNQDIFWTSQKGFNDVCHDTLVGFYKIRICHNIFDTEGKLYTDISSRFGSLHQLNLSDKGEYSIDFGYGKLYLELGNVIRANWLLAIIIGLYLLGFILLFLYFKDTLLYSTIAVILLRLACYIFPLEEHFAPSPLFASEHGFSLLNESIAGYLINTILILFISIQLSKWLNKTQIWSVDKKQFYAFGLVLLGLVFTVIFIYNVKNLIFFSQLNFDFEDLSQLKSLEQASLGALTVNGLSLFIYNQGVFNQITHHLPKTTKRYQVYTAAVLIASLFSMLIQVNISFLWIFPLLFVFVVLFDLFSDMQSKNISWLIWWLIVFSILISSILYLYDMRRDINYRIEFLETAYHRVDYDSHHLFSSEFESIENKGYLNQIINKPGIGKYNINDIIEYIKYKNPALEEAQLEIFAFDKQGNPIALNQYESQESFNEQHTHDIIINDEWTFDPLKNQYWIKKNIYDGEKNQLIYFGFKATPRDQSASFPISYFKNNLLIKDENNLSPDEQKIILDIEKTCEVVYNGPNAYISFKTTDGSILSTKKTFASIIKPIALFSLIFAIFGLFILLVSILNGYRQFLPASLPLKFWNYNSFSIRIQMVIIMLIIISFMGIAWVTVRFINNFINNNENQLIEAKISAVSKNMNLKVREEIDFNNALQILAGSKSSIESIHQSDIEIYSKAGKNYDRSNYLKLDYLPYYYFNQLNGKFPFTIKKKGSEPKSYFVLNHQGENEAVVGIGSNAELKANKLSLFDFLGSIVNVYVFLFLIAGAISIAVARSISRPLSVLGEKMLQLKLGSQNEKLEWKSEDEIGVLIDRYNDMVSQIDESAKVLAKTERDMAWREMAKQVAHEIKNPLTPMKLSIQYLEKAMKSNVDDIKPLIRRICDTLLLQINNLSEIADSFSNFAKLPQANNEKISLNEVVETIHDLFRKRDDIEIKLIEPIDTIQVFADKNHLIRVLNNLVKNAIEAIPENRDGMIIITLEKNNKNAVIKVSDNGIGIPEALHKKVFTPNFTTKNSGSGLGLAIASNMLDTFNAKIYFETVEDKGTDFFIEIPLIRNLQITKEQSRVELE